VAYNRVTVDTIQPNYNIINILLSYVHISVKHILFAVQVMQRDAEVTAEDEQLFLMKLQTQLSKQPAAGQRVGI